MKKKFISTALLFFNLSPVFSFDLLPHPLVILGLALVAVSDVIMKYCTDHGHVHLI